MEAFLKSTTVVDWEHPEVRRRAQWLRADASDATQIARRSFEWVRDEIKHSVDHALKPVTCSASEVLVTGSGFCYAKSHLLAALLRANGIPAGFCYQRLSQDGNGAPYCLHGLNAVYLLEFGWYRIDARGNRANVDSQFNPPVERLAFSVSLPGEADLREIWADPLAIVVDALQSHTDAGTLAAALPDVIVWQGKT
jgi:transglutaminase-like putative cysteine protease